MKAFTSFSSKPINLKLGSLSPRVGFHVSDRPFSCFTFLSRNEQKGSIYCVLKVVQNKGFYPLHAVPSEFQEVELEAVEPQVQQSEQTNFVCYADESKFVRVEFRLLKDCDFGEQFLIVGDDPMLGSWNPLDALLMTWSDGHIWTLELDMPAGKSIQYKFILKGIEGDIIWQPGSDRVIQTWETMNRIIVSEDWENAELQKVVEEDRFSRPNEEPRVLSDVSTSTETSRDKTEFVVSNVSGNEDTRIHGEQKLIDEEVIQENTGDSISSSIEKPMAIIAENIGSSEKLMGSTSHKTSKSNVIRKNEESEDGSQKEDTIRYSGYNGNAAALNNQEGTIVEGSLIDLKGGPVLVPGLTQPTDKEDDLGEVVEEEKIVIESSIETFETRDQNIPELSKDQESDYDTAEEINTTINDELSFHEEQFHLAPKPEEVLSAEPIHGNALRNDVEWGRETVKKFLTKFGLL